MMKHSFAAGWFMCVLVSGLGAAGQTAAPEHVVVYREAGRFGGWPANHGIWSWGDEIVFGFSAAYFQLKSPEVHPYDSTKPEEPRLARSLDGGKTWSIEAPPSLLPQEQGGPVAVPLREPMNFLQPGFVLTVRFNDANKGPSRFWFSTDRGHTWQGAFEFPVFEQPAVAARTDYVINGEHDAFVFVTAAKKNGREGRPLCVRTTDGGLSWKFVSWIGEEPEGFAIMPSTVRLSPQRMVTAVRVRGDAQHDWIDLYETGDNGAQWKLLGRPVPFTGGKGGNPPSLIRLKDGRLCLTYGFRSPPFSIRARLSADEGRTWSDDIVLRSDGAAWDIGYVRTAQRTDGKIVTAYYFPEKAATERIIAATIWDPGAVGSRGR